ncbi:translation initiation factor IF-2 [Vanrija albida]|uniref:Translation initiation factor IF-2, mitochondrial n=1 Tax=Vanrija albida TaxID=181172 RepID=A0ABR3Q660_9TREE
MSALWISSQRHVLVAPRGLAHVAPALRHRQLSSSSFLAAPGDKPSGGLSATNWGAPSRIPGGNRGGRGGESIPGGSPRSRGPRGPRDDQPRRPGFGADRSNDRRGGFGDRQGGRDDARPARGGGFGLKSATGGPDKWAPRPNRQAGGGQPREAPARGVLNNSESSNPPRTFDRPAFTASDQVYNTFRIEEDDFGGRSGRRGRQPRESRSLLNQGDEDVQLPGSRHHSVKGKGDKKGRHNLRQWATEEDDAADEEAYKALRELEAAQQKRRDDAARAARAKKAESDKNVFIPATISVAQLAEKFGTWTGRVQRQMIQLGMSENQRRADYLLNADEASNLAIEFNLNPIVDEDKGFDIYPEVDDNLVEGLPLRPPVVTIMGHVDHGKTTLLDSLRHSSVAAGEAGGITQHIGAFSVPLSSLLPKDAPPTDATITFLDTPGHAAFTGMRARGASMTDLVVLVVAADDGVMPQTKEVIELVKAAGDSVGMVVAINKCDKPMLDIERVKSNLGAEGVILEEDGGDVPAVRVSGLARIGLDDLVETLSTLAEIRDLRARVDGKAEGFVIESHVDKGLGIVATVLVARGTLKPGSALVAGNTWARVRTMTDANGNEVHEATPGTPVIITGWKDVPTAGDQLLEAVGGEEMAKKCIANRLRDAERKALAEDLVAVNAKREQDRIRATADAARQAAAKEAGQNVGQAMAAARRAEEAAKSATARRDLRLVIKGDVSGTVEAVVGALEPIGNKEAGVKIVHTGVGNVSESDIMMAEAAEATVIGFSVDCSRDLKTEAALAGVPLHLESVIYRLIETVRKSVGALLPPRIEHRVTGEATVQQVFEIKLGKKEVKRIAGCRVGNGVISKNEGVRVLRGPNRDIVHEGTMETLRHVKKDVLEIRKGIECGIGLADFSDIREGDEIVTFTTVEIARELD